MIRSVDHINIVVSDLNKSILFYTELLGFREVKRAYLQGDWIECIVGLKGVHAHVVYIVAPTGEPRLELLHYESPTGGSIPQNSIANTIGLRHIAFRVVNIYREVQRLKDAGVTFLGEPVVVPRTVVKHDTGEKILCYFHDPDGTLLELTEYR